MESSTDNAPLIVIVGPTASGKSALALEIAARFNGEIICADSRTIYKDMDIGTAKPSTEERHRVPHHLLDITTPDQPITVADFKEFAERAIDDITKQGKVPFLVGGTGLYIDAVIFNYTFRKPADPVQRARLSKMSVVELRRLIVDMGLSLPQNDYNPVHLIRQIETEGAAPQRSDLRPNTLVLGVMSDKEELESRLDRRLEKMFSQGLEAEVRHLAKKYGWDCRALQTIGYQEFQPYLEGKGTLESVREAILRNSIQYAKRQKTWFRRNKNIVFIRKSEESVDLITTFLNKRYIAE